MAVCTVEPCLRYNVTAKNNESYKLTRLCCVKFAGTAGIGKSQVVMTLAVTCALDYPENTVMFFDTEHNFSAKRFASACHDE